MKRIGIYLDESGEIHEVGRPMNVTGIVTVAANDVASDQFHRLLYSKVSQAGLLAGLCDGGPKTITRTDTPHPHLAKRPENGDVAAHKANILKFIGHANDAAKETGVEFGAFSLVFPYSAKKPWRSPVGWVDQLLDRSYMERVKDALELLFFECPWLLAHLRGPCEVALDLPTRSVSSDLPQQLELQRCGEILWDYWGLKNDGEGEGELRACSLAPADGAEILTSVLGRRHRSLPDTVKILGARCVRLMDWKSWDRDCPNAGARNTWKQKYLAPKQVHYLADLLANSVFHDNSGSGLHRNDDILPWYQRGYFLKANEVDPWIIGSRIFANGDRVGALRSLMRNRLAMELGAKADFFRNRSKDWFSQLGGPDLRHLFEAARPKGGRQKRPSDLSLRKSDAATSGLTEQSKPEILNLLAEPRLTSPLPQSSTLIRWRVLLEFPSSWASQSIIEDATAAENLPNPICVRFFAKDDVTELLLDLHSQEDVSAWISAPLIIGDMSISAEDVTLPSSHRALIAVSGVRTP